MLLREATTLNYLPPAEHFSRFSVTCRTQCWCRLPWGQNPDQKHRWRLLPSFVWLVSGLWDPNILLKSFANSFLFEITLVHQHLKETEEKEQRELNLRDKKATGGLWMNKWMSKRRERREKEAKVDKWEDQLLVMVDKYIYIYTWMWGWSVPWQKVLNAVVAELSIHKLKKR